MVDTAEDRETKILVQIWRCVGASSSKSFGKTYIWHYICSSSTSSGGSRGTSSSGKFLSLELGAATVVIIKV